MRLSASTISLVGLIVAVYVKGKPYPTLSNANNIVHGDDVEGPENDVFYDAFKDFPSVSEPEVNPYTPHNSNPTVSTARLSKALVPLEYDTAMFILANGRFGIMLEEIRLEDDDRQEDDKEQVSHRDLIDTTQWFQSAISGSWATVNTSRLDDAQKSKAFPLLHHLLTSDRVQDITKLNRKLIPLYNYVFHGFSKTSRRIIEQAFYEDKNPGGLVVSNYVFGYQLIPALIAHLVMDGNTGLANEYVTRFETFTKNNVLGQEIKSGLALLMLELMPSDLHNDNKKTLLDVAARLIRDTRQTLNCATFFGYSTAVNSIKDMFPGMDLRPTQTTYSCNDEYGFKQNVMVKKTSNGQKFIALRVRKAAFLELIPEGEDALVLDQNTLTENNGL
ncbi:hypothetical protein H4R33_001881 [Dimargaris cristalligena]|uniref:Uncharacterized protein n=1 Tax=Dimargaris cristalligena TaxID=215637 RepID=A0A4Q0A4N0_9FUNG|nr:hypothetical protein H4R33_001881 [Dimargaris cristalligena]RKP40210.1 hypothetical protein BJ085DRAFT_30336 [Dimargaris cristalligena]|eukprot:RKP40210.1 hypothetical protein BJ085DRAFT_30336 [Dimargaris cristalligena]